MCQEIKAKYIPSVTYKIMKTRFGALETTKPYLYDKPLVTDACLFTTVKIDTLFVLKEEWGENILSSRELLYKLVSGNCKDSKEYNNLLVSYYIKFASFSNYVDAKLMFEDKKIPDIRKIIKPARDIIDAYTARIETHAKANGGKTLMKTHDFIYIAFKTENIPIKYEGMEIISHV